MNWFEFNPGLLAMSGVGNAVAGSRFYPDRAAIDSVNQREPKGWLFDGIDIDEDPTVVIADAQHRPQVLIKGGPTKENTAPFLEALAALVGEAAEAGAAPAESGGLRDHR